ncbi:hypothetical protein CLAFUW4_03792 [Fulvia fulva]|uniref:Uncharacterized protein n=1 Tax=Passalora fulva TaxID=5499 RepID=A0A9Q8L9Q3_PASFU|nr:uncharacterized protein CLAFUR5_03764 [Fulvia fulva]KAK4634000.1 hypothetical protein CLAFUR0_03779 [Fulvia fulva]UJO13432.1 hypothetical protein CLAFUR5_03764 [Fulvia fulva]WPV11404.1 hypothetical protein CLAFUW4_03792 [Fulvia fulva]
MSASKHIGTDALTQGIPPVFCLILAVTAIAIQGTSLKELRSHVGTGHILQKSPSDPVYRLSNVPRTVDYAVNNLSIAAAVICLVAALIQTSGKVAITCGLQSEQVS